MAHANGYQPVTWCAGHGLMFWTQDQTFDANTCRNDTTCLGCGSPCQHDGVMFRLSCPNCKDKQ